MAVPAGSKVFILDKYFHELQRYWDSTTCEKSVTAEATPGADDRTGARNHLSSFPLTSTSLTEKNNNENNEVNISNSHRNSDAGRVEDLIHLPGPLTEDAIIRAITSRFNQKEYLTSVGPVLLTINAFTRGGPSAMSPSQNGAAQYSGGQMIQPSQATSPLVLPSNNPLLKQHRLQRVVQDAVRQYGETGCNQAIILSGQSGSGKTFTSLILLRHLFDLAGGGPETDAFKHLAATLTVLRSLETAKTASNSESSRIGHFIEAQMSDGALYRVRIHSYFLDQSRVIRPRGPYERNFDIFYQLLAGLSKEDRRYYSLEGYSVHNLKYLNCGDTSYNSNDASKFEAWRSSLALLGGITFPDVVRVLSAVLLLGNVSLKDGSSAFSKGTTDATISSCDNRSSQNAEIKAVAHLLGVPTVSLFRGLTMRTHKIGDELIRTASDPATATATRDALAKALYCRTVATIVRRANSLKRHGSSCGTLSSDSNDSIHNNNVETGSHHTSTVGSAGAKSHKSLNVLHTAVRRANDGFIGILDMFGFEDTRPSQLEQVCINLSAEAMQHFYNTHIFKSSIESCREESVLSEIDVEYFDNVPCIDFISSLRTGLLSMLDAESNSAKGSVESYVSLIKKQHQSHPRYFDVDQVRRHSDGNNNNSSIGNSISTTNDRCLFGIKHFAGNVVYDASNFINVNKDVIPDDVVAIFHKSCCTFTFATHLFAMQLKTHFSTNMNPTGVLFRISPTHSIIPQSTGMHKYTHPPTTLTQDFHTRLDNLLRTLVSARPHFVRCIKANSNETPDYLDRTVVTRQIRSLQVLETVNLMAYGFPHRLRFKAFNPKYKCLAPFKKLFKTDDKIVEDCQLILSAFDGIIQQIKNGQSKLYSGVTLHPVSSSATIAWTMGKRHVFLSEGARQMFETLRNWRRNSAATKIQSTWRGIKCRRHWPSLKKTLKSQKASTCRFSSRSATGASSYNEIANFTHNISSNHLVNGLLNGNRPRPQPISGTPPPEVCDSRVIEQTCSYFGMDLKNPPPVPPSRSYTVAGNAKLGYPQVRTLKMDYTCFKDGKNQARQLFRGESVTVLGASSKRGHLLIEYKESQYHIPFQILQLPPPTTGSHMDIHIDSAASSVSGPVKRNAVKSA